MTDCDYVMPAAFGESGTTKHVVSDQGVDLRDTLDMRRPVRSLDQLFTQALGMDSVLRRKVKGYAMDSKGMFPVVVKDSACPGGSRSVLMEFEHIVKDEHLSGAVKWARIKNSKRYASSSLFPLPSFLPPSFLPFLDQMQPNPTVDRVLSVYFVRSNVLG